MNIINRRPRRLRKNKNIRHLVSENSFDLTDLIQPIFIEEGIDEAIEIDALPGLYRISEKQISTDIEALYRLGIRYVMPFGISKRKDHCGSDTWSENGLLSRMIRAIKEACPDMVVIPDICFCEYTDHGHCGVVSDDQIDNDKTLANLAKQSVAAAKAGADILAPSAMMDGQTGAIRNALDEAGFAHVGIMAHSMKYASAFYGPFRTAVDCEIKGDRKTYQADPANSREAYVEASLDEQEGADILMVKPGMPYLDVVRQLRDVTHLPIAAYQVSGEYGMIKSAARAGILDERQTVTESILGFKRAGADIIVTYYAKQIAQWLNN
ncbi:porphobilinogen synthase [Veronia pacifica]|uniref:Delta-aminolevulinic acid dehydratase n=1 Tax=Veronia pacifica TaxID=1080227 RepID=A0A1C3EL50_9GAMM|nr:porphobilinogen synthase [Veronia pacifica]ODA33959.1 delta-aminolevulinic acid dehydratase [Veronia pacifica]